MRKLCLLVALCAAVLCACGNPQPANPLPKQSGNFETAAEIRYKELKATASVSRETPDSCTVVFASPPSLKDMSFVFRRDSVDLSYKGLGFRFDPDSLPGGAVAGLTVSAINRAMSDDGLTLDYADGKLGITGIMDSGEFHLLLDQQSGNLLKLSIPAEELEIAFVNFHFLG